MLRDNIIARVNGFHDLTLAGWVGSECEADGMAVRENIIALVADTPVDQLPPPYLHTIRLWWESALRADLIRVAIVE